MAAPKKYSDTQIANALIESRGMVYAAAKRLGCHHDTIYQRIKTSTRVRNALDRAKGEELDYAELKLHERIRAGDPWAIQFYLKTQGKHRGYTEKTEQQVTNLDVSNLTDEQLRRLAQGEAPERVLRGG